ncbi:MAG: hypothetical protein ABEK75_12815 [Salinibacter sp.]
MYNPTAATSRSLGLSSTLTANAARYQQANARVRLATCNGLPIAFRRVLTMNSGSFATQKWQGVTAKGITSLSAAGAQRLHDEATMPLN